MLQITDVVSGDTSHWEKQASTISKLVNAWDKKMSGNHHGARPWASDDSGSLEPALNLRGTIEEARLNRWTRVGNVMQVLGSWEGKVLPQLCICTPSVVSCVKVTSCGFWKELTIRAKECRQAREFSVPAVEHTTMSVPDRVVSQCRLRIPWSPAWSFKHRHGPRVNVNLFSKPAQWRKTLIRWTTLPTRWDAEKEHLKG